MNIRLPTSCLNVALSMSRRPWESWAYFHFMVWNMWTQHELVDFHGPITFCIYLWFHDSFFLNLTFRRLKICCETTKLIFNISKCICFFTLIYFNFFLIIYVQHYPKPSYIKYHKIICVSHGKLINCF